MTCDMQCITGQSCRTEGMTTCQCNKLMHASVRN